MSDLGGSVDISAVRSALQRYRVMAYVVGILLIILVCVGLPLKYVAHDPNLIALGGQMNSVIGVAHGFLYMVLLITAVDLGRRADWTWKRLLAIALAGTVPFLSFVAEHFATKQVRAKIASAHAV